MKEKYSYGGGTADLGADQATPYLGSGTANRASVSGSAVATASGNDGIPEWKRLLDLFCIFLSLPLLLPLSLAIAILIKLGSEGPILFAQERVGYRGRRFKCFKFRTMKVGNDTTVHQDHTTSLMKSSQPWAKLDGNDPRVSAFGKILRASGLDELPQFINVARGEMSLVGPRPCTPYEGEKYLPWQKERFDGLPGLTGLWQVSGKNKTTFVEMIQMDIRYVRTASLWLDLKIMFMTFPTLFGQMREALRNFKKRRLKNR